MSQKGSVRQILLVIADCQLGLPWQRILFAPSQSRWENGEK